MICSTGQCKMFGNECTMDSCQFCPESDLQWEWLRYQIGFLKLQVCNIEFKSYRSMDRSRSRKRPFPPYANRRRLEVVPASNTPKQSMWNCSAPCHGRNHKWTTTTPSYCIRFVRPSLEIREKRGEISWRNSHSRWIDVTHLNALRPRIESKRRR